MKKMMTGLVIVEVVKTIKTMRKQIGKKEYTNKSYKELLAEAAELYTAIITQGMFFIDNDIKIDGTGIIYNPYILMITGSACCMVINENTVVADNIFYCMSDNAKRFILAHEKGHIKHGHKGGSIYPLKRLVYSLCGRVMTEELQADEYAASIVGKNAAISALKELKKTLSGLSKKEVQNRIKHIKALDQVSINRD